MCMYIECYLLDHPILLKPVGWLLAEFSSNCWDVDPGLHNVTLSPDISEGQSEEGRKEGREIEGSSMLYVYY